MSGKRPTAAQVISLTLAASRERQNASAALEAAARLADSGEAEAAETWLERAHAHECHALQLAAEAAQ